MPRGVQGLSTRSGRTDDDGEGSIVGKIMRRLFVPLLLAAAVLGGFSPGASTADTAPTAANPAAAGTSRIVIDDARRDVWVTRDDMSTWRRVGRKPQADVVRA